MDERYLEKRAIYHLWTFVTSKLIATAGAQVYAFAVSLYILQVTGSSMSFAINLVCNVLPRTIVAPFAGYIIDKYPRKMIAITAQTVTTISVGGLLLYSLTVGLSLPAIYTVSCILSISSMFASNAFTSSLTGLIDKTRIQKASSLNQIAISIAQIASPAIGGLLFGLVSMAVFLTIYLVASLIAVLLDSTMNFTLFEKKQEKTEKKESIIGSLKGGIGYVKNQPLLLIMIVLCLIVNFIFTAFNVGFPFIFNTVLQMSSIQFGIVEGAFAVGTLLLSVYLTLGKEFKQPFTISKRGIIVTGVLMIVAAVPVIITLPNIAIFTFYLIVLFLFGAVNILINIPIMVLLQKKIANEYKGRVFTIIETFAMAMMPLGTLLFGFLYDFVPAHWILLVTGCMTILSVLILARPSIMEKAKEYQAEIEDSNQGVTSV
ncbi:MFS transporter [Bacillus sp. B1-b2]|uniref:MFS transporter n=1 Tax=Bacillus sp. B1-b2 TaxID=2653201 RepID=UPI001261C59C|nr:MFS transporter [Bacillus sp. B1-b2]KAB7664907.1 MFS transporter [Bacillus sp. B1-b2]